MKRAAVALLMLSACARRRPEFPVELFSEVAARCGLDFTHNAAMAGEYYLPEIMGAGAALADIDNDGDLDVLLVQSSGGPHQLFRNEVVPRGELRFTRLPLKAQGFGMGVAAGDYDGDGLVDFYVTQFGSNILLRNRGGGEFEDVTGEAGVDDPRWSTSAVFFDYDRDSRLDLFVLNYVDFTYANNVRCFAPSGEPDYCTPRAYKPVAASLFHNKGSGKFGNVSQAAGITAARGPGLGVTITDANSDGWPDLYVANDTMPNLLWINQRDGSFREEAMAAGVAYSEDGIAKAGMGTAAGDFDNDGEEDLWVANLKREGATLFRRLGPLLYSDVSLTTLVRPATASYTGFGGGWLDYDHDGWLDLFVANGAVTRGEERTGFAQRNILLRNDQGKRFVNMTAFGKEETGRGTALGDIDNDGDIDILVSNNNGPARLFLNNMGNARPWLHVSADPAAGVRAALLQKDRAPQWRRPFCGSSYLSSGDCRMHFVPAGGEFRELLVRWPDGKEQRYPGGAANRVIRLQPGAR